MNKMTKISAVALGTLVLGTSVIAPTANVNTTKVSAAYVANLEAQINAGIAKLRANDPKQADAFQFMMDHKATFGADVANAPQEVKDWKMPIDANGTLKRAAILASLNQALGAAPVANTKTNTPAKTPTATTTAAKTPATTTTATTTTAAKTPAATTTAAKTATTTAAKTAATTTAAANTAATTTAAANTAATANSTTVRGAGHVSNNVATIAFGGIALASLAVLAKKRNA